MSSEPANPDPKGTHDKTKVEGEAKQSTEKPSKPTTASNPHASASLYVGDLAAEVVESNLYDLFNRVGPVASVRVCKDALGRTSLGYAYVNFHSVPDAERALDTMNFQVIKGRQCRIMWSQRDTSLRKSGKGNVFVKNLHKSIDNKTLFDTFSVFGGILSCKVATNEDGSSRGYGYVHFMDEQSAHRAIKGVNGVTISGSAVFVEFFKPYSFRDRKLRYSNIYIRNIPESLPLEKLVALFEQTVLLDGNQGKIDHTHYRKVEGKGIFALLNWDREHDGERFAEQAVQQMNGFAVDAASGEAVDAKEAEAAGRAIATLYVARAQEKSEREAAYRRLVKANSNASRDASNLYVKNLDLAVDDEKLRQMFQEFGEVTSAKVAMEPAKGAEPPKSRGFGFVSFKNKDNAMRAMHEMAKRIDATGRSLRVSRAQTAEFRRSYLQKRSRHRGRTAGPYPQGGYPRGQQMYPPAYPMPTAPQMGRYQPMQPPNPQAAMQMRGGFYQPMPPGYPPAGFAPMHAGFPQGFVPFSGMNPMFSQQMGMQSAQQHPAGQRHQPQMMHPRAMHTNQVQQGPRQASSGAPVTSSAAAAQRVSSGAQGSLPQQVQQIQTSAGYRQMGPGSQPTATSIPQQQASVSAVSTGQVGTSASQMDTQPLTVQMLQQAKPVERKRMIGERLFPKIQVVEPRLAGKITGMLLEMDNYELLILLSDQIALMNKINEALAVLKDHQQRHSQSNAASGQNSQQNQSQANRSSNKNMSAKNR